MASCKRFHSEEAEVRTGRDTDQYLVAIGKLGLELWIASEIAGGERVSKDVWQWQRSDCVGKRQWCLSFYNTVKQNVIFWAWSSPGEGSQRRRIIQKRCPPWYDVVLKKLKSPTVGLEPTTTRLRALRSTDWARRALLTSELDFILHLYLNSNLL